MNCLLLTETEAKRPKLSHHHSRPSSPSKYSLPVHGKEKDTNNIIPPAPSRPKVADETTNADCDTSREPSSTDDGAVDDGVIRCICSITTDDGFTIQCETCEVWQHAVCVNVPIDELIPLEFFTSTCFHHRRFLQVPEHYFCDRCDPSPERRKRLVEMAPQAERTQRQRLQKEADARSQDQDENSIAPDSPCASNHPGLDERDESLVGSPAASTSMSRVSSGARVNDSIHGEPSGQSPSSCVKGKSKASSSAHQERVQTIPYPDNGLGLSGLQESPTTISAARIDDLSLPRDAAPRKPGRKPTKFAQSKSQSSKQSLDPPLSCSVANNVMETDSNVLAQNSTDNDDRYEAWRYEYTPTLKDLYLDAEVKCQVQQLIKHYTRLRSVCDNDASIGSDTETPGQEVEKSVAPASSKSIPPSLEPCRSPAPVVDQLAQVSDIPAKPQRPIPHAFASTNFLPVTMSELPPPSKLTIKAIPPSAINFFPSLAGNPFCPTFAASLNNSSTSSLPRLITHGVFSTQPIPRGSYIASIKGSITSVRKYTEDVYNQYASLGCNKPYVKFFKSTRLEDPFLRDQDLAQIDDGLVIDSRQYGNEMRFVRNGCHPNAFINIIITPLAPRLHDSELPTKPDISQSRTPSTLTSSFPTPILDRPNHPNNLWSTVDCDRPSHWEVSFGIFAASDISRREEIILPWEWDDQHLVHLLPRLLSHSTAFEAQQQRSPTLPPARIQFLPWSMSDLRLLSCKLAAVTLTFFGLMVCGCERKRSCAINLMWKIGCLSAGQPMFPTDKDGTADSEACEMTSISNLKERQEMSLPLTFEEKLRIALNSFLEQPYHLPSKIGRNANPNVNTPSIGRSKKPKIDLGPLLGLKRDWWRYPAAYRSHAESSRTSKIIMKKQKRPRSRSVFNRKPSVHKIRRVSDVGELRQPGLTVGNSINHTKASSPQAHPRSASSIHQSTCTQTALPGMHTDNQSAVPSLSVPLNQHSISSPPPPSSQHAPLTNGANFDDKSFTLRPDAKQDTSPPLSMSPSTTLLHHSTRVTSGSQSLEAVAPQVNGDSQSELLIVQEATKDGNDRIQPGSNQPEHATEVVSEDIMSEEASFSEFQPHAQNGAAPAFPAAGAFEESSNPSSAPEEGELQEDETCSEEVTSAQVLPTGPTPGYQFLVEVKKPESIFVKMPDGGPVPLEPSESEKTVPGDDGDAVPVNQLPAQFSSSAESIDRERPRRASPGAPPEPSPSKSSFVGPDEGKMIEDSHAQDSPRSGTQHPYSDDPAGRPPVRSQDKENNSSLDGPTSHETLPSDSNIVASSHVQDSTQSVASIGELTPQSVVNSPKRLDAQEPPAVALSQNCELELVIQASSKSPEPMHDGPLVDTHETQSIKEDVDDHRETPIIEPRSTDQRSNTNVANVTDQLISTLECQHLNFPAPEETRESPKSTIPPSLNPGIAENSRTESPTRLSRRSMSSTNSEAPSEAQVDESALSQASQGSEEHLLDSDASTTILGSSDEEMLSSHTPRYLNNRKRIRSKNIIKPPPRMAAGKKGGSLHVERPSGLPAGAMARFSKPELRAVDTLKSLPAGYEKGDSTRTSSLSDLESEDQARSNSAETMVKKSGSQMRLTIRSSSPSEIDDIESNERVADKQQCPSKASPALPLSSAPPAPPSNALISVGAPVGIEKPVSVPVSMPSVPHTLESRPDQVIGHNHDPSTPHHIMALQDRSCSNDSSSIAAQVSVKSKRAQDKLATINLPSVVAETQVPGDFQPTPPEKSLVTEKSKVTHPPDALDSTSVSACEVNFGLHPPKNTTLESTAGVSETHSAKAAPKRISLKDYRSRKFSETVVITPLANPLIHFTTSRLTTSTTVTEESHKKQPPPPIIPVLPPLLPPTSQSQPLLPLSPRKLELVASVLKKEDKDHARSSHERETDSKKPKHEGKISTILRDSSSQPLSITASHQLPQGCEAPADEVDLKLSPNSTVLGSSGKISSANIVKHESVPHQANSCAQNCEGAALDSYEDDIDGVAIESMSTQSEGEPDDEVRQQEVVSKEQQLERDTPEEPKQKVQIHESLLMLVEAQPVSGENLEQSEVPTEEQVPVATGRDQQDKQVGVASGEVQKQQQEQVDVELPQDSGLDKSKKSNASDEAEPPSVDGADGASIQDAIIMTVANERPNQMEAFDEAERCPQTNTIAVEDRLPTRSDQLPFSRPERADSPAVATNRSVPRTEEDTGISSTIVQQAAPAPTPKPRLSLADYRRRNVRPSVSEEGHPSQSMSPSLPDLELARAKPPLSSACSQSLGQNSVTNSQPSQQGPKKVHEDAPTPPAAANQARQSSPRPITSPSQQPEHKTKLEGVEPADVSTTLNVSSESRSTDATMYFPPISPSILMAMESPRSPELKSPPLPPGSPSEETSLVGETNVAASCSPWQKSTSRTPLESTPVTSTSSLKGNLKPPIVTTLTTLPPRVAADSAKLSGTEDHPSLGQTAPPAVDSRSVLPLPVVQPPSPTKFEASCASSAHTSNLPPHNTLDHSKTSPSVLVPSFPVTTPSHSHVHQHLKTASVAVPPLETKFPGAHGDQPIPSAPSSRLITASSTSQRSPTIPLSPLAFKLSTSVSPSSPAPPGLPEIKSSPQGRSNLSPALNCGPSSSRTLRAPPSHNNTARASWPPESAASPCQTDPQHTNRGPSGAMPFSDMPINPSLPPPPTHAAGSSRTSAYHHHSSSHRGGRFPPMRNFSGHRATTTTPITGTSGPGPPGSFRQSQSVNNEGVERARYDGTFFFPRITSKLELFANSCYYYLI
ncbi:hypothetical protein VP01_185g7 [Puccinia sorghi]|uniref:SET domain-containing protein n=1 Tax=Puccinia sorghi TaxID=27349 RepID=A0A0L6VFB8_9BASI|nr:hypothetical protein VP01_185g7 [Puccinia sorghi]